MKYQLITPPPAFNNPKSTTQEDVDELYNWFQKVKEERIKIFVGVGDKITTVINNVDPTYINNLKSASP